MVVADGHAGGRGAARRHEGCDGLHRNGIGEKIGPHRFAEQRGKRREVGIPFDQRRSCSESLQSGAIERPYFGGNRGTMAVDENRAVGPLKPAPDAVLVDTTDLSISQVVERVYRYIEERCSRSV